MRDYTIPGALLIHILTEAGPSHRCDDCDQPMMVRFESGLCVFCFNAQKATLEEAAKEAESLVLSNPARPKRERSRTTRSKRTSPRTRHATTASGGAS